MAKVKYHVHIEISAVVLDADGDEDLKPVCWTEAEWENKTGDVDNILGRFNKVLDTIEGDRIGWQWEPK